MNTYLTEACGNTFVLFDCLRQTHLSSSFLKKAHQRLLKENRDDALLLLNGDNLGLTLELEMLVLGVDGQLAEFCGNGARSIAAFLFNYYSHFEHFVLKTPRGKYPLFKHADGNYSVQLQLPQFPSQSSFLPKGAPKGFFFVDMLEPHLVFQGHLEDRELLRLGRTLNQQKDLFPFGINVNACHLIDKDLLSVTTYERGVQRLTQSCGSGSLASASLYKKEGTMTVKTPGGFLEITFSSHSALLKGPAQATPSLAF